MVPVSLRFPGRQRRPLRVMSRRPSRCLAVAEEPAGSTTCHSRSSQPAGQGGNKRETGAALIDLVPPAPDLAAQSGHAVREENLSRKALWRRHVATGVQLNDES